MRGISAILVVILLVIIVVGIVGLSFGFFSGLFTRTTEETQKITEHKIRGVLTQASIVLMSINDVVIRNTGTESISEVDVLINGEPADYVLEPSVIEPNDIGTVKILDFIKEDDEIKIGSGELFVSKKAPDPCDDAILCLNMDEGSGTTAEDTSGHTDNDGDFYGETFNDGTIYGAQRVDGKYGSALSFDGVDDYVNVTNPILDINDEITVMAWFKLDSLSNETGHDEWVISRKNFPDGSTESFSIYTENGGSGEYVTCNLVNFMWNQTWPNNNNNGAWLQKNVWYHVACVYNGSQAIVYLNGEAGTPEGFFGSLLSSSGELRIGSDRPSDGQFDGTIDDIRIWNKSLTQEEIQAEMQSSMPVTKPVASWSLEESGQYINDTHIWIKGKYGKALSFDGVNDYVKISNSPKLQNLNFITIEMWLKPVARNAWQTYITKFTTPFSWELYSQPTETNIIPMFWSVNTTTRVYVPFNLEGGNWYHVVSTFDGSSAKVYVNGNLTNSADLSGSLSKNTADITLMKNSGGNYAQGIIDEVRIFNKAIY